MDDKRLDETFLDPDEELVAEIARQFAPPDVLSRPGLSIALGTRQRSALGVDFCDAFALDEDRTAFAVGDVNGATVAGSVHLLRMRMALRALAASVELPPHLLLARLDMLAHDLDPTGELLVTCVYAVHDPRTGELRLASAGQVTPILVQADGRAELLDPRPSPPLGTGVGLYETLFHPVPVGSLLMLGTKGLTLTPEEHASPGEPDSLPSSPEKIRDALLGTVSRTVALAVARFTPAQPVVEPVVVPPDLAAEPPVSTWSGLGLAGRETELDTLKQFMSEHRIVTVTGPPGAGKSALVKEVTPQLTEDFPDGVRHVDLSGLRDPLMLTDMITGTVSLLELADREMLLVLDGCDHVMADCATLIQSLLRAAPGLKVLTTARQPLGLIIEKTLPLGPLDPADALALLVARVEEAGYPISEPETIRGVSSSLDGLPLTIERAAQKLAGVPIDELALLTEGMSWSHELCSPKERLLWARLSVFDGPFDLTAVEFVCCDEVLPREDLPPLLASLTDRSILLLETDPIAPGYSLVEGVRTFGRSRLEPMPDHATILHLHREWLRIQQDRAI
ncbi:ATP-binding protein [Actinocorallia longicatena]|uniref:PPM-type phosphatase domain-containing protein n=1 Tax=Actinocorallia longicatena TaxID=111803 RepID=A0ABP6Q900_9ACTN